MAQTGLQPCCTGDGAATLQTRQIKIDLLEQKCKFQMCPGSISVLPKLMTDKPQVGQGGHVCTTNETGQQTITVPEEGRA